MRGDRIFSFAVTCRFTHCEASTGAENACVADDERQTYARSLVQACRDKGVLSKNTNELKTGVPGRFDRHRPVASPRSGACRRRCRRFGFSARAGKTPSSNGIPRSRAETWIQARAAPGPERASPLRRGSPGLDSGPLSGLFSAAARPVQRPLPYLAQTWHSKIEIRDEYRK